MIPPPAPGGGPKQSACAGPAARGGFCLFIFTISCYNNFQRPFWAESPVLEARFMRTLVWFIYFWGYMLLHLPALRRGLKALEAGDWAAADALA